MSVIIQGYQLREIAFGVQVIKSAQAVPQGATGNLYTVAGGNVLVTSLIGQVSTVIGSTSSNLSLGTAPTVGALDTDGIGTATAFASTAAGVFIVPLVSSGLGGAIAIGSLPGSVAFLPAPFVCAAGYITWTTSADPVGGAITWYLTYVPLDTGASVS